MSTHSIIKQISLLTMLEDKELWKRMYVIDANHSPQSCEQTPVPSQVDIY